VVGHFVPGAQGVLEASSLSLGVGLGELPQYALEQKNVPEI
jgi:hypothetical protein